MILANFQVKNNFWRVQYFQKTFLVTNISAGIIFGMLFLTLSNLDIEFAEKELI